MKSQDHRAVCLEFERRYKFEEDHPEVTVEVLDTYSQAARDLMQKLGVIHNPQRTRRLAWHMAKGVLDVVRTMEKANDGS